MRGVVVIGYGTGLMNCTTPWLWAFKWGAMNRFQCDIAMQIYISAFRVV